MVLEAIGLDRFEGHGKGAGLDGKSFRVLEPSLQNPD